MEHDKAAAIAAIVILGGGAWWYARRAQSSAGLGTGGDAGLFAAVDEPAPVPLFAGASWSLEPLVSSATGAVQTLMDSIVQTVSPGSWTPPATAAPYLSAIVAAEDANGIPRNLLARLLYQESRFRPEFIDGRVRSPAGAIGIAQFMPATAADEGVNPLDPFASIAAAGRYLRKLYNATGDWKLALASYNWGVGNVTRKGLAAAPTETQNYVAQIAGAVGLA